MASRCIRPVERGDIATIKVIAEAAELFPGDMLDDMIAPYFARTARDIWFVATQEEEPVGFGFCEPERMTDGAWNLLAIGVSPERQGQGLGGAMMAYLEDRLSEQGERVLLVETMGTPAFDATRVLQKERLCGGGAHPGFLRSWRRQGDFLEKRFSPLGAMVP